MSGGGGCGVIGLEIVRVLPTLDTEYMGNWGGGGKKVIFYMPSVRKHD